MFMVNITSRENNLGVYTFPHFSWLSLANGFLSEKAKRKVHKPLTSRKEVTQEVYSICTNMIQKMVAFNMIRILAFTRTCNLIQKKG